MITSRLNLDPAEKFVGGCALAVLLVFLVGWAIFIYTLPTNFFWALPAVASAGLWLQRRTLSEITTDADAANLIFSQVLITLWSVGWLALVLSYSGGDWLADWFGHQQRTWFFLDHGPLNIQFNGFDPLPSRPPLANVVTGAFLTLTERDFAHYQFFSTLLGSLVFLPAALLARRMGNGRAIAVLAVLFMVNPMYLQNVTYAWTKLPAAFFVLTAVYFFLRAHDRPSSTVYALLFAITLASGLLTHYSTGPCAVALAVAWMIQGWAKRKEIAWRQATLSAIAAGTLILFVWFGWAFSVYGITGTLTSNSSFTDQASSGSTQWQVIGLNIRDTIIPHFLRQVDFTAFTQRSVSGEWRDRFFTLYQNNFFFSFGSAAWAGLLVAIVQGWPRGKFAARFFWVWFTLTTTVIGVGVIGSRHPLGLAHICLQPLVLLGLAYLAASLPKIGTHWKRVLLVGATVDVATGILLQFGSQAFALERCFQPNRSIFDVISDYSRPAQMNFYAKLRHQWMFMGDVCIHAAPIIIGLIVLAFVTALIRADRISVQVPKDAEQA
jgi:dolichyl-phosphate-mannose-protein mannosyltransferase